MKTNMKFIQIISIFMLSLPLISTELFTSIVHLEKLLSTEKQVIDRFEQYLLSEEERISRLKNLKLQYNKLHKIFSENVHHFSTNPINSYILIKRLTTDFERISQSTCADSSYFNDLKANSLFPTQEDLRGSAEAIFRLQDTYKLETKLFANGIVSINNEKKLDTNSSNDDNRLVMTSDDCYELGLNAYTNQDFYNMEIWMQEAFERMTTEKHHDIAYEIRILEYLSYASYMRGNFTKALELTKQILVLSPDNERALVNVDNYEKWLEHYKLDENKNDHIEIGSKKYDGSSGYPDPEQEIYKSLCRGENRLSDKIKSNLFCFHLNTDKIPYLRYTRIKVEEAFKRPQIVVFHDILSDSEIEVIKSLAEPILFRSGGTNRTTGELDIGNYRTSKVAWLKSHEHPVIDRVEKRIKYVTGLDLSNVEPLQVANYGIGGHYITHHDFALTDHESVVSYGKRGNRIATWLSYMSNVEAGGSTVFPSLGITIWPKKSSAAFWYNLLRSGDLDFLTNHAACPVLIGSKWASNKWFHERGQEFQKPCSRNKDEFNIIQNV